MTDGVTRCVSSLGGSPQRLCTSAPPRDYESYGHGKDNQVKVRQRNLARATKLVGEWQEFGKAPQTHT